MLKSKLLKLMPYLESDGGGGTGGAGSGEPGAGTGLGNISGATKAQGDNSKIYTQADLDRITGLEKKQGASALLKALGFDSEEDAQAFVKTQRETEEKKKDDATKAQEALEKEKKARVESDLKVLHAEHKIAALSAGVPADHLDDVIVLAESKLIDGKTFESVLDDLKKTYPAFFEAASNGTGGTPLRGGLGAGTGGSIGKRLAEQRNKNNKSKQNLYFQN